MGASATMVATRRLLTLVIGKMDEGEVRQPAQRASISLHDIQQETGIREPFKSGQLNQPPACVHREQHAGYKTHVMVERQPGDDSILRPVVDRFFQHPHLRVEHTVRHRHAFLKAGRAAGML